MRAAMTVVRPKIAGNRRRSTNVRCINSISEDRHFAQRDQSEIAISSKRLAFDAALPQSGKSSSNELFQKIEQPSSAHLPRIGSFCGKVSRFATQPRGHTAI